MTVFPKSGIPGGSGSVQEPAASCSNTVVWGDLMKRMSSLLAESAVLTSLSLTLTMAFGSLALAQGKTRIGTWELNLEKSTFSPGPAPRQQTLTFQEKGPQWMALIQGTDASGKPINLDANNLMITFDGRDHPTPTVRLRDDRLEGRGRLQILSHAQEGRKGRHDFDQHLVGRRENHDHHHDWPERRRPAHSQRQGLRQTVAARCHDYTFGSPS